MAVIGNLSCNLYTVASDSTAYTRPTHSVSHTDMIELRRTLPSGTKKPLRTVARFERGFEVTNPGVDNTSGELPVVISIAVTVPPGVNPALVKTYITEALTESAQASADLALSGDIHLGA